jgi:hypothetical protein
VTPASHAVTPARDAVTTARDAVTPASDAVTPARKVRLLATYTCAGDTHHATKTLVGGALLAFIIACATNATNVDPLMDITPRAQGTITLGASHAPGSSTITPSVSVSFVPDTSTVLTGCGQTTTATCVVTQAPDCMSLGCKTGETCGWDGSCNPSCVKACTMACPSQQKCGFAGDGSMGCHPIQTFDAGPIVLSGTNMTVAVYPPYAWKGTEDGSPFVPGDTIRAQASGPVGAGYIAFEKSFKATTLLVANPALDQLQLTDVFGSSDLNLGWLPGNDRVYILATGAGGAARCFAEDPLGSFTLPRSVIAQVMGTQGANALSLSIERMRIERQNDMKTSGALDNQTIQPQAWLDLATTSTETIALQACKTAETACGTKCVNTQTDTNNCGSCGTSCMGEVCVNGSCQASTGGTCSSCEGSANLSTCSSAYGSCQGTCKSLLACVMACNGNTTCGTSCRSTYSTGLSAFDNYWSCLCGSACSSECSSQCSG